MNHLNVVLLEPEIPQNTGNIARTCAATGVTLHMIEPFGFRITDRNLRRAGLDYWRRLDVRYYGDIDDFYAKNPGADCLYFTRSEEHTSELQSPRRKMLYRCGFFGRKISLFRQGDKGSAGGTSQGKRGQGGADSHA